MKADLIIKMEDSDWEKPDPFYSTGKRDNEKDRYLIDSSVLYSDNILKVDQLKNNNTDLLFFKKYIVLYFVKTHWRFPN